MMITNAYNLIGHIVHVHSGTLQQGYKWMLLRFQTKLTLEVFIFF